MILPAPTSASKQPDDQVSAEVNRQKNLVAALKLSDEDSNRFLATINQAEKALQAGHLYLSLNLLQQTVELRAFEYRKTKLDVEKGGVEAFEQEWRRVGEIVSAQEKLIASKSLQPSPLIIKAMIERAVTQVRPTYKSGRLYAQNTTITNGLLYMGIVQSYLEAALFFQNLQFNEIKTALRLRPIDGELNKLEAEILEAYRRPNATDQQQTFNYANMTLKMAWDLNREKRYAGALLQYLEAARAIALTSPPPVETLSADSLKSELQLMRTKLTSSKTDHSIGEFYWQMASSAINRAEGSPDKGPYSRAAVVLNRVLPLYLEYVAGVKP
jgi:hypothetical protein